MSIKGLTTKDAGTYERRASNNPDRNHLTWAPGIKWVHAQASVVVFEHEWPGQRPQLPSCATRPWLLLGRTQTPWPRTLT